MNASEFLNALTMHNIVSTSDVDTLRDALSSANLAADAEAVAKDLVRKGMLTKYQAAHIYKGRTRALVFGEYIVLDKLGAGGMGQVFKAQHRRMKRIVALKVLPPQMTNSATAVKRFYQEVEMAARLTHPNIVTAYDAGEAHKLHYLAMEFVDGKDLSYIVTRNGPLSVDQAMYCVAQAARGLHYAHQQGIIHRDVKPSNLLVDRHSVVKILDMGLARLNDSFGREDDGAGLTEAGQVLGTIDYMAPEQAHDTRSADHRADIYGLGCTLFRLLTDRIPYPADTILKKILAHREQPIPSLRSLRSEVPPRLDQLCQRMLAKAPAERIASMAEVASTLDALLAGKSDEASSVSVLDEPAVEDDLQSFLSSSQSGKGIVGSSIGRNTSDTAESAGLSGISSSTSNSGSRSSAASRRKAVAKQAGKETKRPPVPVIAGGAGAGVLLLLVTGWWLFAGGTSTTVAPRTSPPKKEAAVAGPSPSATPTTVTPTVASVTPVKPAASPPSAAPQTPSKPPAIASATPAASKPVAPASAAATKPATSPPASAPALPAPSRVVVTKTLTGPVDLLKVIDARQPSVGKWSFGPGGLVRLQTTEGNSRIAIPFSPPGSYDLTLTAEGPLGENQIRMGLVVGGFRTCVDWWPRKGVGGYQDLADIELGMADAAVRDLVKRPVLLTNNNINRTTLTYAVRPGRVCIMADGALALDWTGDPAMLSPSVTSHVIGDINCLCVSIGGTNGDVRISKLEIAPPLAVLPTYSRVDLLARYAAPGGNETGVSLDHGDLELRALSNTSASHAEFSFPRPSQYSLSMVIERTAGRSHLWIGLPVGNHIGLTWIGGENTKLEGFDALGEKRRDLMPWRLHTMNWTVSANRTALLVDGRPVADVARSSVTMGGHPSNLSALGVKPAGQGLYFRVSEDTGFRIRGLELTPAGWQKLPRPRSDALAIAMKSLSGQAAGKGTPEERLETAKSLLRRAATSLDDDAYRYAALETAATLAAGAGDLSLACHAAIDLARTFDGDFHDLFARLAADAFRGAKSSNDKKALVEAVLPVIDLAMAWEQFDLALALQTAALAVTKPPTSDLAKELKARGVELQFDRAAAEAFAQAELKTDAGKADDAAHADAGRYLGFVRNNWSAAAREFDQAGDMALRDLARAELDSPRISAKQATLGDLWWALADKSEPPLKYLAVERALAWSQMAADRGAKNARTSLAQHQKLVLQQRRTTNMAFVARHSVDAIKLGGAWYKWYPTGVNWNLANQMCEEAGGSLPIITTDAENQAIGQLLTSLVANGAKPECWLGLTDHMKEGNWVWTDGSLAATGFVAWENKQPDNGGGNEHYARFEALLKNGQLEAHWHDQSEGSSYPVLCQWRQ